MIVLDTSLLVPALSDRGTDRAALLETIKRGDRLLVPSLVAYEWLRGPRTEDQLLLREELFPDDQLLAFTAREADRAADLYRQVPRARTREIDIAIAAHALVLDGSLWTLNVKDFDDVPGLDLFAPSPADDEENG